jgi:hypothetical protein
MSTWRPSWILGGTGFQKMNLPLVDLNPQKKTSGKSEQVFMSYLMETKARATLHDALAKFFCGA